LREGASAPAVILIKQVTGLRARKFRAGEQGQTFFG
jgi:hypothetical protein